MKKIKVLLYTLPLLFLACNNEAKDSVEIADSTNREQKEKADSTGAYRVDEASSEFLVNAANNGMSEVKMSEIAVQKAANKKVTEMAQLMIVQHKAFNKEVVSLAAARKVQLPLIIGDKQQKDQENLNAKTGKDFDKAYLKTMIKNHEDAIVLFKKANDKVNDADIRTFANNKIPTLQMHLDSFRVVQKLID